jgi:hypothetical protein
MPKFTLVLACCALVLAVSSLVMSMIGVTYGTVDAQDSWVGPPGIHVGARLSYLRIDGRDYEVGHAISEIAIIGSNGGKAGKWLQVRVTSASGEEKEMWLHMDNIQLFAPEQREVKDGDSPGNSDG